MEKEGGECEAVDVFGKRALQKYRCVDHGSGSGCGSGEKIQHQNSEGMNRMFRWLHTTGRLITRSCGLAICIPYDISCFVLNIEYFGCFWCFGVTARG